MKKEINIEVGLRIKRHRENANLTQEVFAELLNMETNSISAIERGVVGISITTMQKICTLLSISADEILFDIAHENNVEVVSNRLKKLSPKQFEITSDIISKLIEGFNII